MKKDLYKKEQQTLKDMGFLDEDYNFEVLSMFKGSAAESINYLLQNPVRPVEKVQVKETSSNKEDPNLKKLEKVVLEIDKYIENVHQIYDGTLKVKDLKFEMVKYDELFTQKLCVLDGIQGDEQITLKRREQIKKIFACIEIIEKIKSNL